MESSQVGEAMAPFHYNDTDFCQSEMGNYNGHEGQDIQAEMQAITDPGLNNVLLGLSGPLDTPSRYVGLTLGDIPLTNMRGELNVDRNSSDHQGDQTPPNFSFPVDVPPGHVLQLDEHGLRVLPDPGEPQNNHLMMQEMQMIHQSEQQQQQQQHHQQQQLTAESAHGAAGSNQIFHDQTSNLKMQNCHDFNYDHKLKSAGILTAWEESVKYMEDLRQLQELHLQQQQQQSLVQQKNDQFCLDNMGASGMSGSQSFGGFSELDKIVDQENAFPHDKLPADNFNPFQSARPSIIGSASNSGPGFASSSIPVYPSLSNFRRPTGPVNSCYNSNPHGHQLLAIDRSTNSNFFGVNGIQAPALPYPGPFTKLLNYSNVPAGASNSGAFSKLYNYNSASAGGSGLFTADLPPTKSASSIDQLQLDYGHGHGTGHNNELQEVFGAQAPSSFLPEVRRTKSAAGRLLTDVEPKPLHHFATERQRREHLNEKYQTLRSLVPNPTKADRASIVSDAINRIHELKKEEESLLEEKKERRLRKQLRLEMRINSKRQRVDGPDIVVRDEGDNFSLKAQWIKKISKHGTEVEVRIICDEVEVNIKQIHMPKFLLRVMTAIEGFKLHILDGSGGVINNCDIYRFKLKIKTDSCALINVIMTKLIEILDAVF